ARIDLRRTRMTSLVFAQIYGVDTVRPGVYAEHSAFAHAIDIGIVNHACDRRCARKSFRREVRIEVLHSFARKRGQQIASVPYGAPGDIATGEEFLRHPAHMAASFPETYPMEGIRQLLHLDGSLGPRAGSGTQPERQPEMIFCQLEIIR